jgi:tRNA modification GTPase
MTMETIYAPITASGKAAVAAVRVSGARAHESLRSLITGAMPESRHTSLRKLVDPVSRETIDHAMVILFSGAESFTGEDSVEYHLHGGAAITQALLSYLSRQGGHRMAEAGEFTRRAFENGKIDLTEAEAIADLAAAQTQAQKDLALDQLGGALSRLYDGWRERLTRALAYLEADIDFPDEDLPDGVAAQVRPILEVLRNEIAAHLNDNRRGEMLREGIKIAVIGAPNAGKSSLVNALAQRDVAIVSSMAGTTRDIIEVHLNLGGYPVILSDTAGLRPDQIGNEGHDAIESEGIRRALNAAQNADIKLLLFDATQSEPDAATMALRDENALVVFNKADAASALTLPISLKGDGSNAEGVSGEGLSISVQTGVGLDTLTNALIQKIKSIIGRKSNTPTLTRARHREALEHCRAALDRALSAPLPELIAEDVRLSVRALGRITGRVDVEDLLDVIFRDFCIGK